MKRNWFAIGLIGAMIAIVAAAGTLVDQGAPGTTAWKVNITAANATFTLDGGTAAVTQSGTWTVTTTPPSNASTNVTQLAGNGISTGSGASGTGTQRVILATDQQTVPVSGTVTSNPAPSANAWIHTAKLTTVTLNATTCAVPSGASCTNLYGSTAGVQWILYQNLTISLINTGSNALTDAIVEWSPDGSNWEVWDATTFAGLAAGAMKSLALTGNSRYLLRVEGRSASGTTIQAYVDATNQAF